MSPLMAYSTHLAILGRAAETLPPIDPSLIGVETGVPYAGKINSVTMAITAIATVVVGVRVYIRSVVVKNLAWDDYLIVLAMVASIMQAIGLILQSSWGNVLGPFASSQRSLKAGIFVNAGYMVSIVATKTSILVFCFTVFSHLGKKVRGSLIAILVIVQLHFVAGIFTMFLACRPFSTLWHPERGLEHCFNFYANTVAHAILSTIEDAAVLAAPLVLVSRVFVNAKGKQYLFLIFGLGALAFGGGLARCIITIEFLKYPGQTVAVAIPIGQAIEINVGIIAASLPALSPLLKGVARNVRNTVATMTGGGNRGGGNTINSGQGGSNGPFNRNYTGNHSAIGALAGARLAGDANESGLGRSARRIGKTFSSHSGSSDNLPLHPIKVEQAYTVEHVYAVDKSSSTKCADSLNSADTVVSVRRGS